MFNVTQLQNVFRLLSISHTYSNAHATIISCINLQPSHFFPNLRELMLFV